MGGEAPANSSLLASPSPYYEYATFENVIKAIITIVPDWWPWPNLFRVWLMSVDSFFFIRCPGCTKITVKQVRCKDALARNVHVYADKTASTSSHRKEGPTCEAFTSFA
jgi:hypothetical protein